MYHIKILFLLILLTFNFNLSAQGELEYSEVVELNEVSKDVLYSRGLIWFAETFNDSRDVIEIKDREGGLIIGNVFFKYYAPKGLKYVDANGYIQYQVKVMFREGRTKIVLNSFTHRPKYEPYSLGILTKSENYPYTKVYKGFSDKWHQKIWENLKVGVPLHAEYLLSNFKEFMSKSTMDTKDW